MVVPGVIFPRGGKIFQNVIKKLNGKTQLVSKKTMLQLGPPDKNVAYGVSPNLIIAIKNHKPKR